jgi:oligopeptide transport system substrate-binding protein
MFVRRSAVWVPLVVLTILGLVFSACQGGPQGPAAQADLEGELILPAADEPDTIDPQKESFVDEVAQTMMVFSALMTFDPKTLKTIPDAASGQPQVSSDGLTYTFKIKDHKYSDGKVVTANDFVYGFKRLCDPEVAGEYAFTGFVVVGCEAYNHLDPKTTSPADLQRARDAVGVRAVDDKTVEYKLTEKAPYFVSIAGLWVGVPTREDMVKKGGDKWTEPETFIGNGPFVLKEWRHNERLVFERNEQNDPKPKLKRIVKPMISEASVAFAAYRNNEIDIYGVGGEDRKVVEGDPELSKQLIKHGGSCTFYYGFNTAKAPFDDQRVRLAFAKAVDREAYVRDIAQGIAAPATSFIPPGFPGHDPEDSAQKFDAAAAKQLLTQSRYGTAMPAIKFTYSSSARAKTRAEWAVGQWKQNLGLDIALDPVDSTTYTRLTKDPATVPQLFTLGWCADYPDEQDWLTTVFHSQSTVTRTGWKNAEFDRLTREADAEPDQTKRADLYKRAQRILTQEAPAAFYFNDTHWTLVKPWVQGYQLSSMDFEFGIFSLRDMFVTAKNK